MRSRCVFSLLALIGSGTGLLWGNWGSTAGGSVATGNSHSFGTQQVEMLHENLVIRLYRDRARVEVDYDLHNTGAAVDVRAGFPSLGVRRRDEGGHPQEQKEIEDYSILADGQSVSVTREKGDPAPLKSLYEKKFVSMIDKVDEDDQSGNSDLMLEWFVSKVHFAANQTRHIHIRYESLYAYCAGGYSDDSDTCDERFAYVLSTGAAWKGPIVDGQVTIQPVTVDAKPLLISPKDRFARTKDGFVWQFHNLKPAMADNIVVSLNNHSSSIASYEPDGATVHSYYVLEGGRYFLLTNDFSATGDSSGDDNKPSNVNDESYDSSWRTAHSPGIGDTITLTMKKPTHFDQVGIMPGCGKDKREWLGHTRVKQVELTVNGTYTRTATLTDEYISFGWDSADAYHWMNLPAYTGDAKELRLTVLGTYPGNSDQVTCIEKITLRRWLPSRPDVESGIDGHKLP